MQERVFMGIGNKPFMDIQPSEAAISNRAVNCVLIGRGKFKLASIDQAKTKLTCFLFSLFADNRFLPCEVSQASPGGLSSRPKSVGSGSTSSSSSSSGRGSLSPVGYVCGPTRRATSRDLMGYMAPHEGLEEDDLDHRETSSQNLLRECAFRVNLLANASRSTGKGDIVGCILGRNLKIEFFFNNLQLSPSRCV